MTWKPHMQLEGNASLPEQQKLTPENSAALPIEKESQEHVHIVPKEIPAAYLQVHHLLPLSVSLGANCLLTMLAPQIIL